MATTNNSHHNQKRLLHELLQDDQEPFLLHAYISDRRRQIVRTRPKPPPSAAVKKRKPISQHIIPHDSKPARSSSCFFSFAAAAASSPAADPRKSPLYFGKTSPLTASPKTASLLLEAALRISRNMQARGGSNRGTGIFGSLVKRLTNGGRKNKTKKTDGVKVNSVKDYSPVVVGRRTRSKPSPSTLRGPSWTESSSRLSDDEYEFANEMFEFAAFEDKRYCDSPFHFVLQPQDGSRTPDFSSPAASPIRLKAEGNENNKDGSLRKCQIQKQQAKTDADADAEEKEQCSPVSVLDPPFDDEEDDDPTEDGGFDNLDCSYAFVQRTKQHLLHKLCRFEKLAELDPIELDKLMLDHEQEGEEDTTTVTERKRSHDDIDEFVMDELSKSRNNKIPRDMKMLVSDLIDEEENYQQESHQIHNDSIIGHQVVAKRVCKRFESWKEVESNTIDMMVEQDFDRSQGEWRRKQDEVDDIAMDIEVAIFGLLVEELSEELTL